MKSDELKLTEIPASLATLDDILEAAISHKWISAGIILISLIAGVTVALLAPLGQRAQTTIFPLTEFDILEYQTPYFLKFMKTDPAILNGLFVEAIRDGKALRDTLIDNKIVVRKPEQSAAEFGLEIEQAMAKLILSGPAPESQRLGNKNWTITFDARSPEIGYKVLTDLFERATQTAKLRLTSRFNKSIFEHERAVNFFIEENQRKRENLMADYNRTTADKLAQLDEQTELLKTTGTKRGQVLSAPNPDEGRDSISVIDTSKMVFLPGYEQVEKQASLMRSRVNKESFVTGLLAVDQEIRQLQQDRGAQQGRLAFSESPLARADFKTVTHDLSRASFRRVINPVVIVLGALALGLFAAAALILAIAFRRVRQGKA